MSRDGQGELVPVDINGPGPTMVEVECGSSILGTGYSRYRRCQAGHIHCSICLKEAHRFRKGYTCGFCTKATNRGSYGS